MHLFSYDVKHNCLCWVQLLVHFQKPFPFSLIFGVKNDDLRLIVTFLIQGAVNFALMMSQMEGGCPVDYNTITDLFLQVQLKFSFTCHLIVSDST